MIMLAHVFWRCPDGWTLLGASIICMSDSYHHEPGAAGSRAMSAELPPSSDCDETHRKDTGTLACFGGMGARVISDW